MSTDPVSPYMGNREALTFFYFFAGIVLLGLIVILGKFLVRNRK